MREGRRTGDTWERREGEEQEDLFNVHNFLFITSCS
jgi:hypothetical protein